MIFVILASLFLSACVGPDLTKIGPETHQKTISISTGNNINSKMALGIDLVIAYSQDAFNTLKGIDARTFLQKRSQLMLDNADGMAVWSLDFTEHQHKTFKIPKHRNFWGLIIFLHFINSSQNRIIIPMRMHVIDLHIADSAFSISENAMHHGKHEHVILLSEGDEYSASFAS